MLRKLLQISNFLSGSDAFRAQLDAAASKRCNKNSAKGMVAKRAPLLQNLSEFYKKNSVSILLKRIFDSSNALDQSHIKKFSSHDQVRKKAFKAQLSQADIFANNLYEIERIYDDIIFDATNEVKGHIRQARGLAEKAIASYQSFSRQGESANFLQNKYKEAFLHLENSRDFCDKALFLYREQKAIQNGMSHSDAMKVLNNAIDDCEREFREYQNDITAYEAEQCAVVQEKETWTMDEIEALERELLQDPNFKLSGVWSNAEMDRRYDQVLATSNPNHSSFTEDEIDTIFGNVSAQEAQARDTQDQSISVLREDVTALDKRLKSIESVLNELFVKLSQAEPKQMVKSTDVIKTHKRGVVYVHDTPRGNDGTPVLQQKLEA